MDHFEDSLTKEIRERRRDVRPTTTGEIAFAPKDSSNLNPYTDGSKISNLLSRPHAPIHFNLDKEISDISKNLRTSKAKDKQDKSKKSSIKLRKKKSSSITELWNSLEHFSHNNLSRSLQVSSQNASGQAEVHFVNIDAEESLKTNYLRDDNSSLFAHRSNVDTFRIPELPQGKFLKFNILSTWGDEHYLGLMGIEIFDKAGHLVTLSNVEQQIWANPPDINILPEYGNDPRTIDNLLDGVNLTSDDIHAWLTPFTTGQDHLIYIEFDDLTSISMIRIWNYNKSRIHSYRGARYVEISLDDRMIFKGEIKRAPGGYSGLDPDACSECILFTKSPTVLCLIEK